MTDRPDIVTGGLAAPAEVEQETAPTRPEDLLLLEVCFISAVGLVVLAALAEAFTYKLVSSRTPFVIMVPLLILIAVHLVRLLRQPDAAHLGARMRVTLAGELPRANQVVAFSAWMLLLMVIVVIAGHYIGIAIFMFVMIGMVAREKRKAALLTAGIATALIFALFEYGFDIELYRGLVYRYFAGYRIF